MKQKIEVSGNVREELSKEVVEVFKKLGRSSVDDAYVRMINGLFKELNTPIETLLHATVGISGEAGELLDAVKKSWIYGKPLDVKNVVEELADMHFYITKALLMLGIDIYTLRTINMYKLAYGPNARFPEGVYSNEAAIARADKNVNPEPTDSNVFVDRHVVVDVNELTAISNTPNPETQRGIPDLGPDATILDPSALSVNGLHNRYAILDAEVPNAAIAKLMQGAEIAIDAAQRVASAKGDHLVLLEKASNLDSDGFTDQVEKSFGQIDRGVADE